MELTRYGGRADVAMRKREELSEILRFLSCAGTSKGEKGDRANLCTHGSVWIYAFRTQLYASPG